MNTSFFNPFVGSKYTEGISGKRILVIGASFYCNHTPNSENPCHFFPECTNPSKKDSSPFDLKCPAYSKTGQRLSDEPSNAINEGYRPYKIFATFMRNFLKDKNEDVWQRMAFTDYVQFFVPTLDTKKEYLSKRDFEAFIESLMELKPNVVITWGLAIIEEIRENNPYVYDLKQLPETEWYICHIRIPSIPHDITLVCSYHPSSIKYWYENVDTLKKYLEMVLKG